MNVYRKKNGFSTVELLTVIAILVVLASALLKIAKGVRTQAEERLTSGQIDIVVTALQQYYDDNYDDNDNHTFPFVADPCYMKTDLETDTGGTVDPASGAHEDEYSSSEAMFYFLDRSPNSSKIISAMSNTLISSMDQSGNSLAITIGTGAGAVTFNLVRFIDPWGKSLRYTYMADNAFPVIESAGVDGDFDTSGDNISSR